MELPEEFVRRMRDMLGEEESKVFLSSYYIRLPVKGLRLNPFKLPAGDCRLAADALRLSLRPVPWAAPYGFYFGPAGGPGEETDTAPEEDRPVPRPGKSPLHDAGLFYIQEPSAMAPAALSGTRPGEMVLDLCAAPGGKATMLASMLGGKGLIVANEVDRERAGILSQNVERMGIPNAVVVSERTDRLADRFACCFDRVLVDAPCSGEGMFRTREQAAAMWSRENVALCAERQARILDDAARMVRYGGTLVYSTCTFAPEEDEGSVAGFLMRHPDYVPVDLPALLGEERMRAYGFCTGRPEWAWPAGNPRTGVPPAVPAAEGAAAEKTETAEKAEKTERDGMNGDAWAACTRELDRTIRLWPHCLEGEGHFVAVMRRTGGGDRPFEEEKAPRYIPETETGGGPREQRTRRKSGGARERGTRAEQERRELALTCLSGLMAEGVLARWMEDGRAALCWYGDDLYLTPYAAQLRLDGLRVLRPGLQLGVVRKNRFEPAHALAMALRPQEARQSMQLDAGGPQASAWLHGETLPCDPPLQGWTLVTIDGISAGWGKASGGMLRNHYPKGLRR